MIRSVLAAVLAVAALVLPGAVQAQLLKEAPGWGIRNSGPAVAKGVVYFVRGYSADTRADWLLVPYFLRTLNADGWDVIVDRVDPNYEPDRSLKWPQWRRQEIARAINEVQRRAEGFTKAGYKTVVGSGHSFGGWALLEAAVRNPKIVSQLVLSVPTAHGKRLTRIGKANVLFQELTSASRDRFGKLRTPTFVALFNNDEFEPPQRADAVAKVVAGNQAVFLANRPPAFTGHFAAWTPIFDYVYGDCIARLLGGKDMTSCARETLQGDDWRSVVSYDQLAGAARVPLPLSVLEGHRFVRHGMGQRNMHVTVGQGGQVTLLFADDVSRSRLRHSLGEGNNPTTVCIDKDCGRIVMWSESVLLEFGEKRDELKSWWVRE